MSLAYAISGRSPQALSGLGFSIKHLVRTVTKPLTVVHNLATKAVTAPLKVSSAILRKLPGGGGIAHALTKGAASITNTSMMSQNLLNNGVPGSSGGTTAPPEKGSTNYQTPGIVEINTPYNQPGNPPSSGMPPGGEMSMLPIPSSGGSGGSDGAPSPVAAKDTVTAPSLWQNPLTVPVLALVGVGGYYLYHRYKNR